MTQELSGKVAALFAAAMKRRPHSRLSNSRLSICITLALSIGAVLAGGPSRAAKPAAGDLVSSTAFMAPVAVHADARLLIYYMPTITGGMTKASTLLFIPKGTPPAGGWPVIAWSHGTTTAGQKTCAPSLSATLDGGLTADGFPSDYVFETASLVNAGYAVVSPDFEGLGAVASVPYPYYNIPIMARSLIDGVRAAHQVNSHLSNSWVVVGHSDGAHGALGVEAHAAEAPELKFLGTVALAPYDSIAAGITFFSKAAKSAKDPVAAENNIGLANFNVALMAVALMVQSPSFDPSTIMGKDLKRTLPEFRSQGSAKAFSFVNNAIKAKGAANFAGFKPDWANAPQMRAFLAANDPAVMPGFMLHCPTLIVQGTKDALVPEALDTAFVTRLTGAGAPITYKRYPGADHFTVIRKSEGDVIAYLRDLFHSQGILK